MAYLFSNPNPQGVTPAQATAGAQIQPINLSGVVAAILEHQRMQQQQQQAYQHEIAQGISSLSKQYEQGQADDAANAAQYQSRYPGDNPSYAGFQDRVPDYGGTMGLQASKIAQQIQDESTLRDSRAFELQNKKDLAPLEKSLLGTRIIDTAAQASQRQNIANYPGGIKPADARHLSLIDKDQLAASKEETANALGVSIKDLPAALGAANQYKPGENRLKIGDHEYSDQEGGAVQSIVDAARSYQDKLKQYSTGIQGGQVAQPIQHGPPPGTQGSINGIPAVWNGSAWIRQ